MFNWNFYEKYMIEMVLKSTVFRRYFLNKVFQCIIFIQTECVMSHYCRIELWLHTFLKEPIVSIKKVQ